MSTWRARGWEAGLHADLAASGTPCQLVEAHAAGRDILRAEGLEERLGQISRRMSVDDIIETFHHHTLGLNI
jgi:hypothetical protein